MQTTDQKLGTANIKRAMAFIIITSMMVAQLIKNFSLSKAAALGFHLAENQDLLQVAPAALAEFRDTDTAEAKEITDYFDEKFDIANDELEARIEAGIDFIPEGYELIKRNVAYVTRVREFVRSWGDTSDEEVAELKVALAAL